ncbi:RNA polymerase sigma factor [Niabella ginsengisoli]|uniref:RNA polymerase sigma factor n=1 Tax=Niabella ginsengisoli TaxID=522298 RepID=A0ABS9SG98_9BACT|nr:RNA polymerase sigma factor [Niabella ginsengisoli]MCH5597374.1 RNA polymerase sigma factor [Niabella ginsengisoli]
MLILEDVYPADKTARAENSNEAGNKLVKKHTLALSGDELEHTLKGCQNNKEHHKEALYRGFYGYLKGVVIRYVNDYHFAEELVNDSFIKIFNNISSFNALGQTGDITSSFKAWVAKIASRTAIDFLRKKKIDFGKEDISEMQIPPLAQVQMQTTEAKDILKLLNKLPHTQKAIFNLYEIEGFTHQEISGLLAIPENVSRSYLSRAKNKLKALYSENFRT